MVDGGALQIDVISLHALHQSQEDTTVISDEIILAHGSCFKAKSFGAARRLCVFIYSFFTCLVDRNFSKEIALP